MNSKRDEKNKNETLFVDDPLVDTSVSDIISQAFDKVELSTIGKICLDARVQKSLTQEQASNILKVRVKIIKDFENGDEIDLPGLTYKVGFVRSYARLLELDGDFLVQEFKSNLEPGNFREEYKFLAPKIENNNFLPMGAVLSFLIAIIIYSGWYYSERNKTIEIVSNKMIESKKDEVIITETNNYIIIEEKKNFESNSLPSVRQDNNIQASKLSDKTIVYEKILEQKLVSDDIVSKNNSPKINEETVLISKNKVDINKVENISSEMSAVAKERDRSSEMVIKAIGNSWVEIEDIDGNSLMARIMRPGETYVVPNKSGLTFNTGNAGALSLSSGNITISSLGEEGETIKARPLNIEAFKDKKIIN
jgi:cytoskeleton protein RodZ